MSERKRYVKRIVCPSCGMELIRLEPYVNGRFDYTCLDCKIDISIVDEYYDEDIYEDRN